MNVHQVKAMLALCKRHTIKHTTDGSKTISWTFNEDEVADAVLTERVSLVRIYGPHGVETGRFDGEDALLLSKCGVEAPMEVED